MQAIDDKVIIETYNNVGSIRKTASELNISWQTVTKCLSTHDIITNDVHYIILKHNSEGKGASEIAKALNISEKTVKAYLPRTKPKYGMAISKNAKAVKRCRDKKEADK